MATIFDVAAHILQQRGPMSAMKLQKLCYYAQAWSLVWDGAPIFNERIEAWANGPVVPKLYNVHRGQFTVAEVPNGDPSRLTDLQRETVDAVLGFYGDKSPKWLSDLTHMEDPWKKAREGLDPGMRCKRLITLESMAEYYESL